MKTEIYRFDREVSDIGEITGIAERMADYNGLDNKQKLKLVLLCEELVEMLPNLLIYKSGEFWIDNKGPRYEIHILVQCDDLLSKSEREDLLSVSRTGRNASAVGIMNKIRIAAETMYANSVLAVGKSGKTDGDEYDDIYDMGFDEDDDSRLWTLGNYKRKVQHNTEAWDELEKSIIANLADDVTVGILNGRVNIVVKKLF